MEASPQEPTMKVCTATCATCMPHPSNRGVVAVHCRPSSHTLLNSQKWYELALCCVFIPGQDRPEYWNSGLAGAQRNASGLGRRFALGQVRRREIVPDMP